ncbi:MAG: RimK family alpha-L-glutamate ligase, partial [Clostridia bacterium]|nr:RimK family alpha-L-glutamate ligase [Clostridia bacterium]
MTGLFVKNAFLRTPAFDALYALVEEAAQAEGVTLLSVDSASLATPLDEPPPRADFALFWDKDVTLAARLAASGIPVFNSPETIRICDSKAETAIALRTAGVRTPRTVLAPLTYEGVGYSDLSFVQDACRTLGLPLIIKEAYGSFGEQVYLAKSEEEALAIAARIGARPFLMQEFIAAAFGTDVRVNVVGDKVISAMRRYGKEGDFRSN